MSFLFPAPIGYPGSFNQIIHTLKAVWFLIWIQELISYSLNYIYFVYIGILFLFILPFIQKKASPKYATWFPKELRFIHVIIFIIILFLTLLTIVGIFFRGENWRLRF